MQAILTKYIAPANRRPARVEASCGAGSASFRWNHDMSSEGNHALACHRLCQSLEVGVGLPISHGQLPSGDWSHVFISRP